MSRVVGKKSLREIVRIVFFFSLLLFILATLITMPRISIPLSVGYLIFLIISPAVPALMKFGLTRMWSIGILFSLLLFFTSIPIIKVVPLITSEAEKVQYYIPKIERYVRTEYRNIEVKIEKRTGYSIGDKYITEGLQFIRNGTTSFLLNFPKFVASVLEWVFLVPLFVFFLLKDSSSLRRLMLKLTPNSIFERYYYISHQFNKQLGDYIFAKFVEASIVGIVITSGLLIMDIRFALLLGLIAAATNVIPYVGPIIGSVPGIILVLAEYGVGAKFGGVLGLYIVANVIDIALVFPILVSKIVNLHPVVVVISVILGSQYFGIMGMIISIPMAAALKLIFQEIYSEIYNSRWN